ncbi:hypothetical protein LTR84_000559 [Exophiala bonariae]|uniref:Xylanolytic transcriptional activator regulatory domain-containing protein n=1 Tax=Exophiala bonariae TaxID=1690606 RepID=A0AAV9NUX2_9EURO|nr:hypothetical protein LTR84_000559 [Exophiala bonariae]
MRSISTDFFTGTHQRISTISKIKFHEGLVSLATTPNADFATLCLAILLIQEMPVGKGTVVQSPLYATVKSFINMLEASNDISLDLAHCRVLVTFYEMGHGLHTAAYLSVAGSARLARTLGLHRKPWRSLNADDGKIMLEEKKRVWWAIGNMDRFISLCLGDAHFATNDSERRDPLPIEDLLWSEISDMAEIEHVISSAPSLDTPFDVRVGQMARECQISHLAGRVVRHVFDPLPDQDFNVEEGLQLERTLKAYLPLLANEELEIGKYCGAFGVCNSALFVLYEFMLSHCHGDSVERDRIVQSINEISIRVIIFAEATHRDREVNYPIETQSPYLIYSLYQAAVVQSRLWKQENDPQCKRNLESLNDILHAFTNRWMITWQYLDILENINDRWSPIVLPFQGVFISSGQPTITS